MSAIVRVPIAEIVVGDRKRSLGDVTPLAESIAELGLLQPIVITEDRRLVAGMHRLEACRNLGWQEIDARIVQADDMRAELAEIDENLVRNELTALERAEQLARRKTLYEALHPETKTDNTRMMCITPLRFHRRQLHRLQPGVVCANHTAAHIVMVLSAVASSSIPSSVLPT